MTAKLSARDYKKLSSLLGQWTGINLHAKETLMSGRLQPRLRALGLASFGDYFEHLERGGRTGPEAQHFMNALTTNKTSFFREPHHFDFLTRVIFAEARASAADGGKRRLRLWSAGCSRGAEPYTMAMLAAQHLPASAGWDVRILATDIDTAVLARAAHGSFDEDEVESVPPDLRARYFAKSGSEYRVQREAASLITFAQANLIAQPFPVRGRFDAIFCRNVMIYFNATTQRYVVDELVKRLGPNGYLVIGHSESMLAQHLPRGHSTVGVYRAAASAEAKHKPAVETPRATSTRQPMAAGRARQPVPGLPVKRIVLGEWFASDQSTLIATLLGSCVAACVFDPVARVGGMNHFMLPEHAAGEPLSARFGIHAMEVLINELMRLGAHRARLQAMAFGAAAVNRVLSSTVAAQNGAFIRHFLAKEQIPLVCERLGGTAPREVYLRTDTGEAFVRRVEPGRLVQLSRAEVAAYQAKAVEQPAKFNPDDALF